MRTQTLAWGIVALVGAACAAPQAPAPAPAIGASAPPLIESVPTPTPTPGESAAPVPKGRFVFYEDFEKSLDAWTIEGASMGVGWSRLNAYTCGGAWTMLLGKGEQEAFAGVKGASTLALKQPIVLAAAKRPHLVYDVRGTTTPESAVTIQAEASRDGKTWQAVGEPILGRYRFVFSRVVDLGAYAGAPALHLRFAARFDVGAAPVTGMLLDDVKVIEAE